MKNNCKIIYTLLCIVSYWGGSSILAAPVLNQSLYSLESKSTGKKPLDSLSGKQKSDEYIFDSNAWRSIFKDAQLKNLIEQGLQRNTNLNVARLRIDQAEASLKAARLAFLPSLSFSPTAGISTFGASAASKTYSLPLQASWQIDLFGKLKNAKLQKKMTVESSKAYQQAVQVNLIANIAREYYQYVLLDAQLSLALQSVENWNETVRAMKAFMEEGQYTDAAVSGAEASCEQVKTTAIGLQQQMRETLNSIRLLVGDSTNSVVITSGAESADAKEGVYATVFNVGININALQAIPLHKLSNRPDVRQAEMNLAAAIYATQEARAAFYPSLSLTGAAGWTNSSGFIVNPGKILLEALASLTQPIFQNGNLKADLAIKKSQQQEARLQFRQTLLNAGVEVNNALTEAQTYNDKSILLENQVKALERTVKATRLLQQNGSSNYLEVLTAQENLLSAKMSRLENEYNKVLAQIALYQAMP